jgi:hypothetical protein
MKKPAKKLPEKNIRNLDNKEPKMEKRKKPPMKKSPAKKYC